MPSLFNLHDERMIKRATFTKQKKTSFKMNSKKISNIIYAYDKNCSDAVAATKNDLQAIRMECEIQNEVEPC